MTEQYAAIQPNRRRASRNASHSAVAQAVAQSIASATKLPVAASVSVENGGASSAFGRGTASALLFSPTGPHHFDFGGKLCLFPQPFPHLPSAEEWRRLIERVAQLHAEHGIDLLVIDSLTHFLRAENVARGVLQGYLSRA